MAWNYAQARLKHLATGRKVLPEEGIDKRLDVCALCELRVDRQCSKCGCFLDEGPGGLDGKAVWPEQDCPFAKWPVVPLEYR
jgi:hypothetical protein